jgi:superfamily II DNA/RNA helicase
MSTPGTPSGASSRGRRRRPRRDDGAPTATGAPRHINAAPRGASPTGNHRPAERRPQRDAFGGEQVAGAHGNRRNEAASNEPAVDLSALESAPTPTVIKTFGELGVPAVVIAALKGLGVTTPFPIQAATLPDSMAGRDVLGRGKTGSGKTIAFAIPTVARLALSANRRAAKRPRALILVPTRELANQVADTVEPIAEALGLRIATVFGGVGQGSQVASLKAGVDVLVACPGRLEDLISQNYCSLDAIEVTVLDEADHMADLGFLPGVRRLLDRTPRGTQRLLFSATLDNGIDVLVRNYLSNPVVHSVDPAVAPVSTMTHHVLSVSAADKPALVQSLAAGQDRSLLFTRTKHGAKKIAKQLTQAGIPAVELHGNLSQNARERNLESFTAGTTRVLVATDIAARGIHVDDIALVVHVDPPAEHKAYLHRSGRTARAGAAGVVVTIMTPDQASDVRGLAKAAKISPIVTQVTPTHALITELVGPPAAFVKPAPPAAPDQPRQRTGQRNGQPPRKPLSADRAQELADRKAPAPAGGHRGQAPGARTGAPSRGQQPGGRPGAPRPGGRPGARPSNQRSRNRSA